MLSRAPGFRSLGRLVSSPHARPIEARTMGVDLVSGDGNRLSRQQVRSKSPELDESWRAGPAPRRCRSRGPLLCRQSRSVQRRMQRGLSGLLRARSASQRLRRARRRRHRQRNVPARDSVHRQRARSRLLRGRRAATELSRLPRRRRDACMGGASALRTGLRERSCLGMHAPRRDVRRGAWRPDECIRCRTQVSAWLRVGGCTRVLAHGGAAGGESPPPERLRIAGQLPASRGSFRALTRGSLSKVWCLICVARQARGRMNCVTEFQIAYSWAHCIVVVDGRVSIPRANAANEEHGSSACRRGARGDWRRRVWSHARPGDRSRRRGHCSPPSREQQLGRSRAAGWSGCRGVQLGGALE